MLCRKKCHCFARLFYRSTDHEGTDAAAILHWASGSSKPCFPTMPGMTHRWQSRREQNKLEDMEFKVISCSRHVYLGDDGIAHVAVVGQDERKSRRNSKTKTGGFIGLLLKAAQSSPGKRHVSFWKCFTFIHLFSDLWSARGARPLSISECNKFLLLTNQHSDAIYSLHFCAYVMRTHERLQKLTLDHTISNRLSIQNKK